MRPQVFASTVFVLLQRRTQSITLCPPPPVGLKCFFNTIDVFKRSIIEKRKKRHIKTAQFARKIFSVATLPTLCATLFRTKSFSALTIQASDLNAAKHTCQYNLNSNLVFSFNGILAFLDTRLAKCYIRHCLHGGGITFLKGLPF